MPRTKLNPNTPSTNKTTPKPQTITISEACAQLSTNQQSLRLALSHIRPDDFDTVKALPQADLHDLGKLINPPQLPATGAKTNPNPENPTTQESQPATDGATKAPMSPLANSTNQPNLDHQASQAQAQNHQTLIDMLAKQATEEIEVIDGLARVKNAVIMNNLQARDAELAQQIQERHIDRREQYMNTIRDVASLAQDKPQITQDTTDITTEIDALISELGKQASL
jgi:hypothetical protein